MAIVRGLNQHFDAPLSWHVYRVEMDLVADGDTGEINIPLDTLPEGTLVAAMSLQVHQAEQSATATRLDVEFAGTAIWAVGSDPLGTVGFDQATSAEVGLANFAVGATDGTVAMNMEVTITGTATQAPIFTFMILCGRVEY